MLVCHGFTLGKISGLLAGFDQDKDDAKKGGDVATCVQSRGEERA